MELSPAPQQPILQPLTLGQLLDRAFRLYRRHFGSFIAIVAAAQIPAVLLSALFTASQEDPSGLILCLGVVAAFASIIVAILGNGALVYSAGLNYLGQPIGFSEAWRYVWDRWMSLVGMQILLGIYGLAIVIGSLIAIIVGWLSMFGMIMFFSAVIGQLALVVLILEYDGAANSITRAWNIARQRFWWILGYMFVLTLLGLMVGAGPVLLATGVTTGLLVDGALSELVVLIIQTSINALLQILYVPLQLTAVMVMYIDFRVRFEGLDLALQVEEDMENPQTPETILRKVPPAENQSLITWAEWGNFVLISIGFVVLYAVFAGVIAFIFSAVTGLGGF